MGRHMKAPEIELAVVVGPLMLKDKFNSFNGFTFTFSFYLSFFFDIATKRYNNTDSPLIKRYNNI